MTEELGSVVGSADAQSALPPGDDTGSAKPLKGDSGRSYGEPSAFAMPAPTTVSQARDGHPSGRHMIDGFRMMSAAALTSGGAHQKEMAKIYETVALCIENEARRADRAEAKIAFYEANTNIRPADPDAGKA